MNHKAFDQTSVSLGNKAGTSAAFVLKCGDRGDIPFVELPNGVRTFRAMDAPRVRELKAQSIARRGRWRSARAHCVA